MIECRMIYYPIIQLVLIHNRKPRRVPKIYLDEARFVVGYFSVGDAKSFEVVAREGIENSVDTAVAFGTASLYF